MKWLTLLFALMPTSAWAQFYVSPTGQDVGVCSASAPCKTINYTVETALASCVDGNRLVINLSAGYWQESLNLVHALPTCASRVGDEEPMLIQGAGSGLTTWNGCPTCSGTLIATGAGTDISVRAMRLMSVGGPGQNTLYAQKGGLIQVQDDINFGQSSNQHIHCEDTGSTIQLWRDYTVSSGTYTGNHMAASTQCGIYAGPLTVTLTPNIIFGGPMLFAQIGSVLNLSIRWVSQAVNGQSYLVQTLSMLATNGAGCGSIPGSHGIVSGGGQCF
jgi:hypothetical protein